MEQKEKIAVDCKIQSTTIPNRANTLNPPIDFRHPPLFIDFLKLYKQYYKVHQNLPKLFRVTIGERIMHELSEAMKLIVMANFNKKNKVQMEESQKFLLTLRGKTELLKAYFLIGWEMKIFSHGLFSDISEKLETISKQSYSWSEWFQKQIKAGDNAS